VATAQNVAGRELRRSIEAAESERRRWARELHDETLQDLAGLRLAISAVRADPALPEAAGASLDRVLDTLTSSVTALRHLISDLRPAALDELGVGPALETLVGRTASMSDLEVRLDVRLADEDGRRESRLVPAVEEALYRLVQEGLTNALKHAVAERVDVRMVEDDHVVEVTVRDDGRGFDPEQDTEGFGLVGMRERVALAGGTLEVRSSPGEGVTIRAVFPARRRNADVAAEGVRAAAHPT
jgi:signal transduction histidine kinase